MGEVRRVKLSLGSYFKIVAALSLALGLLFGLFALVVALTEGGTVTFHVGSSLNLKGVEAAFAWLVAAPVLLVLVSPVTGLLLYVPVQLFLRLIGGLRARD